MRRDPIVAIAGATGLVGNEMLTILDEGLIPFSEVRLLASEDSAGELYRVGTEEVSVETLNENSFEGVDIALFATSAELSAKYVPLAISAGAAAIDNSSYFRMQPEVPLIVPEVNGSLLKAETKLVANPNCSTIQLVPILDIIEKAAGLKRVVVSSYQSVSGAGKLALDELWQQTLGVFNQREIVKEAFQHQIAFNCIPQIDVLLEDGYTKEEKKIMDESRKILGLPALKITATAVRVPVLYSHAESVNVETQKPLSAAQLCELLHKADGIRVYAEGEYPLQQAVAGSNEIHVGRVRRDISLENGLNLWIVADNVRKGAALNAIQIAKQLIAAAQYNAGGLH